MKTPDDILEQVWGELAKVWAEDDMRDYRAPHAVTLEEAIEIFETMLRSYNRFEFHRLYKLNDKSKVTIAVENGLVIYVDGECNLDDMDLMAYEKMLEADRVSVVNGHMRVYWM